MVPHAFKRKFSFPLVDFNTLDLNYMYNYAKFLENGVKFLFINLSPVATSINHKSEIVLLLKLKWGIVTVIASLIISTTSFLNNNFRFLLGRESLIKIEVLSGYQLQGQFNGNAEPIDPRIQVQLIDPNYDQNIGDQLSINIFFLKMLHRFNRQIRVR